MMDHGEYSRRARRNAGRPANGKVWRIGKDADGGRADGVRQGTGGREEKRDGDGAASSAGAVGVHPEGGGVGRGVDSVSDTSTPIRPAGVKQRVLVFGGRKVGEKLRDALEDRKVSGETAQRRVEDDKPALVSKAMLKGIMPAILVVAGIAGGFLGTEVVIDQEAVTQVADKVNALYGAVLVVIGIVTWFVKTAQALYKQRHRIKENGLKVHAGQESLVFGFEGISKEDGFMLSRVSFVLLGLAVCGMCLLPACVTSARESFVEQGSVQAQKLADVLGEAQAKTLDGALKFFQKKREVQITNIAKWKEDAGERIATPANQFALASFNLAVQDTDNKIALIEALKAEAAAVPTGGGDAADAAEEVGT